VSGASPTDSLLDRRSSARPGRRKPLEAPQEPLGSKGVRNRYREGGGVEGRTRLALRGPVRQPGTAGMPAAGWERRTGVERAQDGLRRGRSAVDAVAQVGGVRGIDHPNDVELDLEWQHVEEPSAAPQKYGNDVEL
jgi:hypothetical protein